MRGWCVRACVLVYVCCVWGERVHTGTHNATRRILLGYLEQRVPHVEPLESIDQDHTV